MECQRHEAAGDAITVGRSPTRGLDRRQPRRDQRRHRRQGPFHRRRVECAGRRAGRSLEQSCGIRWIGAGGAVRDHERIRQTADVDDEHRRVHDTRHRRHSAWGRRLGTRPAQGIEAIAPIELRCCRGAARRLDRRRAGRTLTTGFDGQAALHSQGPLERLWRQQRDGLDRRVRRAEAVHPADALRQPRRRPRQVVMHDARRVLQVESLACDIGGDEYVGAECGAGRRRALCPRGKRAQHFAPRGRIRTKPTTLAGERRHPEAPAQESCQVTHRGARIAEDDGLDGTGGEQPSERAGLGIGVAVCGGERATDRRGVVRGGRACAGLEDHGKQRQLDIEVVAAREDVGKVAAREGAARPCGVARQIEECRLTLEAGPQRRQARRQAPQQHESQQGRRGSPCCHGVDRREQCAE